MRNPGDVVLVHYQEQPTLYARIESIEPDIKKDWYKVNLLLLTIPPHEVTWILRAAYVDGESFTMGGRSMRLGAVKAPAAEPSGEKPREGTQQPPASERGRVIPFRHPREGGKA